MADGGSHAEKLRTAFVGGYLAWVDHVYVIFREGQHVGDVGTILNNKILRGKSSLENVDSRQSDAYLRGSMTFGSREFRDARISKSAGLWKIHAVGNRRNPGVGLPAILDLCVPRIYSV